jgi:hypothetical protein
VDNCAAIAASLENAQPRSSDHEIVQKPWNLMDGAGPKPMHCLLVTALFQFSAPNCGPANVAALADQNITNT